MKLPRDVNAKLTENEANCCTCYNANGPCVAQEHTRSVVVPFIDEAVGGDRSADDMYKTLVNRPKSVIVTLCIMAFVVFAAVFALLQCRSRNQRGRQQYRDYQLVSSAEPKAHYDNNFERISLTGDDMEDSLFEKT